jgi:hypothetical protein
MSDTEHNWSKTKWQSIEIASAEIARLQSENKELRGFIAEARRILGDKIPVITVQSKPLPLWESDAYRWITKTRGVIHEQ